MKKIPLFFRKKQRKEFALIDDECFGLVSKYKWYLHNKGYAVTHLYRKNHYNYFILMHRLILKTKKNKHTDHINKNRLDNRKINLRECSASQNAFNTKLRKDNTTGFRGVTKDKRFKNVWYASIYFKNKPLFIGSFKNKESARLAYEKKAKQIYGEFAKI